MIEDLRPYTTIAEEAARLAGAFCHQQFGRLSHRDSQAKGPNDFFTYVDVQSEEMIVEVIRKYYPEHTIIAEEGGVMKGSKEDSEFTWHIDPVDGTNNYIHKVPFYAVSIGVSFQGKPVAGVVFAPQQNELYRATDGGGAFMNNRRIRVSETDSLASAMVTFGFPHRNLETTKRNFDIILPVLCHAGGVRRCGSAALDLAWLACGRFDGYLEFGLQKHDIAAGTVIVREAGGLISAPKEKEDFFETGNIIAGGRQIHAEILRTLAQ